MSVRIRLARIGKKKAPFYRIVAIDKRVKRDGKFLENLGTFNPVSGEIIQFHADRVQAWIEKGAIPSDTVKKLQHRVKKGEKSALERVEPIKKQTPSKAELEAEEAKKKAAEEAAKPKVEEKAEEATPAVEAKAEKTSAEPKVEKTEEKPAESKDKA